MKVGQLSVTGESMGSCQLLVKVGQLSVTGESRAVVSYW